MRPAAAVFYSFLVFPYSLRLFPSLLSGFGSGFGFSFVDTGSNAAARLRAPYGPDGPTAFVLCPVPIIRILSCSLGYK